MSVSSTRGIVAATLAAGALLLATPANADETTAPPLTPPAAINVDSMVVIPGQTVRVWGTCPAGSATSSGSMRPGGDLAAVKVDAATGKWERTIKIDGNGPFKVSMKCLKADGALVAKQAAAELTLTTPRKPVTPAYTPNAAGPTTAGGSGAAGSGSGSATPTNGSGSTNATAGGSTSSSTSSGQSSSTPWWLILVAALVAALGGLVWFRKRQAAVSAAEAPHVDRPTEPIDRPKP